MVRMNQQRLPLKRVLEIIEDISHKLLVEKQNEWNVTTDKREGKKNCILWYKSHIEKKEYKKHPEIPG